jgi:hypothetical protein
MIEYILLSGFAGGAVFGFILKLYLCKDEEPIISESDSPRSDTSYVNFLEDMLDNTTHITNQSYALQEVDASCPNITEENVIISHNENIDVSVTASHDDEPMFYISSDEQVTD